MNIENITDKEILDSTLGGIVVREMTSITFLHWIAAKLNGVKTYSAANQELVMMIASPPMGRMMPEEEKCRLFRKLQSIIDEPLIK